MTISVVDALDGFTTLVKRSQTLGGSVPLRVAQACVPLLEGNAWGYQVNLTRRIELRKRFGRWTVAAFEGGDGLAALLRGESPIVRVRDRRGDPRRCFGPRADRARHRAARRCRELHASWSPGDRRAHRVTGPCTNDLVPDRLIVKNAVAFEATFDGSRVALEPDRDQLERYARDVRERWAGIASHRGGAPVPDEVLHAAPAGRTDTGSTERSPRRHDSAAVGDKGTCDRA